jgi:hypothetical protein
MILGTRNIERGGGPRPQYAAQERVRKNHGTRKFQRGEGPRHQKGSEERGSAAPERFCGEGVRGTSIPCGSAIFP